MPCAPETRLSRGQRTKIPWSPLGRRHFACLLPCCPRPTFRAPRSHAIDLTGSPSHEAQCPQKFHRHWFQDRSLSNLVHNREPPLLHHEATALRRILPTKKTTRRDPPSLRHECHARDIPLCMLSTLEELRSTAPLRATHRSGSARWQRDSLLISSGHASQKPTRVHKHGHHGHSRLLQKLLPGPCSRMPGNSCLLCFYRLG